MQKIATKLTKKVAEFVKEVSELDYSSDIGVSYFHYPNISSKIGFEYGYHSFSELKNGYTEVSEQEFIDMVTDELFKEAQKPEEMKTKCIVLGQENEPVKELKKIELIYGLNGHSDFNKSCGINNLYTYKEIILLSKSYSGISGELYDLIFARKKDDMPHQDCLFLGHWNDGVV